MTKTGARWLNDRELAAWTGLIRLSSRMVGLVDVEMRRDHGITGKDYELLHHLSGSTEGLRINALAERIDDTSSCITHRVNRLQQAGIVEKRPDPSDQRARLIVLQPHGRQLLEQIAPDHVERVRTWIIDALDPDELDELTRLTTKLVAHLRDAAPPRD